MPRWTLTDPRDASTYELEIGPSSGGELNHEKTMLHESNAGAGGTTLLVEGQDVLFEPQFAGTLLSEAQYGAMTAWFDKDRPLTLSDDLGRSFTILWTEFAPIRPRSATEPWKHTWTGQYVVLAVL